MARGDPAWLQLSRNRRAGAGHTNTQINSWKPRLNIGVWRRRCAAVGVFVSHPRWLCAPCVGGWPLAAARYADFRAVRCGRRCSGATAGLAGALEVAGPHRPAHAVCASGYGFAAIIVGLCGALAPGGDFFGDFDEYVFTSGRERLTVEAAWRLRRRKFQGLPPFSLLARDIFDRLPRALEKSHPRVVAQARAHTDAYALPLFNAERGHGWPWLAGLADQ